MNILTEVKKELRQLGPSLLTGAGGSRVIQMFLLKDVSFQCLDSTILLKEVVVSKDVVKTADNIYYGNVGHLLLPLAISALTVKLNKCPVLLSNITKLCKYEKDKNKP